MGRTLSRRRFVRDGLLTAFGARGLVGCVGKLTLGSDAQRFSLPAEWAPHAGCLMAFPTAQNWEGCYDGRCDWLDQARTDWAAVANTIVGFEPVTMICNEGEADAARALLSGDIELVELPINDAWTRDTGPLLLTGAKGGRRAACFTFNGWGSKYVPWDDDAALKERWCDQMHIPTRTSDLVLEGGAITVDGEGTLITTESVLLNTNRNPHWNKRQIEDELAAMLGISQVIWLAQGTVPDPITDGHVDGICAFVAPGVVMLHTTDDRSDPNHAICEEARERLTAAKDAAGRKLEIIELPLGTTIAHINFYLPNGGVVVPLSGIAAEDDAALAVIRDTFPDREVTGIVAPGLAEGGGGVHCITQQIPSV
jgi:agmatine deiminase